MPGGPKNRGRGTGLDDDPGIHDVHPVGDLRHHAQVVGDIEQRHAAGVLQPVHQAQNLGLDGYIQGGGRLVGNDQLGAACQGHGDHRPLALATAQLVRVVRQPLLRRFDADVAEQLQTALPDLGLGQRQVDPQRLGDLLADGEHRVQRRQGLLEDHSDAAPADGLQGRVVSIEQVLAAEAHPASGDLSRRTGNKAQQGQGRHGLTATRFSD